uniref:Uncharacterized protein n=2 Tax=Caenorhabditis japonica TaxID=281687 RepID=A0A8R1I9P4_CAEJA
MLFIYENQDIVLAEQNIFRDGDLTTNYMNVCALPVYNFWHPDVMKIVNYKYNPLSSCDKTFKPFTQFTNGNFTVVEDRNCSARCFTGSGDYDVKFGEWLKPGPVGNCEFLEAVCWENSEEVYGYIHTQITPQPPTKPPIFKNPPNVFVFLFDSLSTGQAKRSFPNTLSFLSSKLESVEFPFINKVGENSWPNGMALWFGKLAEAINNENYQGGGRIPADWNRTEHCSIPKDNYSIFEDFKNYGYMTQDIDDWAGQMVNYPNCHGFSKPPTHHYMHPFFLVYERLGMNITKEHLKGKQCREEMHASFEYFQQFVDAYPDRPKFSWWWLNSLGHDSFNGFMRADKQVLELFEENSEMLQNSFVFFMGDHGYRIGRKLFLQSPIGSFEMNNPYLSISIPKHLRSNHTIMETLRQNSQQLQTHFDTRATMLDILKFQPNSSFSDRHTIEIPNERGHSFLRRQPSFPRTCGRLPIPSEYCICRMKRVPIIDKQIQNRYGHKLIDYINKKLKEEGFSSKCENFEFRQVQFYDAL